MVGEVWGALGFVMDGIGDDKVGGRGASVRMGGRGGGGY